ncbi:coiled-coil domain-containing protein 157-like [Prorops nasuta]|uniref:coiled-coil domain-containing protein 157-like n=1 Tax=Prorops nasuta TaxID=863751 RepID=UPI0034CF6FCA
MPKLNKRLIASIRMDIDELESVANEMYSRLGKSEAPSWKYPTKTARAINAMEIVERHEGSAGELYILLLELAYDRSFNFFPQIPPI